MIEVILNVASDRRDVQLVMGLLLKEFLDKLSNADLQANGVIKIRTDEDGLILASDLVVNGVVVI